MPNRFYPAFKSALLAGDADMADGTVNAVLVDTSEYTFSEAHDALNDVPAEARLGAPQTLAGKAIDDGVFDASDITFAEVPSGGTAGAVVIYIAGQSEAQSRLVAYFDTMGGAGMVSAMGQPSDVQNAGVGPLDLDGAAVGRNG